MAGITLPGEIGKWLKKTGWEVQRTSTSIFGRGLANLKLASRAFASNQVVFFFIKAKSLSMLVKKGPWLGVDHWITLTSSIKVRKDNNAKWESIHTIKEIR